MDKENKNIQEWNSNFFIWEFFLLSSPNTITISTEVSIDDNKNGTISLFKITYETTHGNKVITQKKETILQRCLSGQVYRIVQNDCQGIGTKATIWGAQKYQWCPSNDTACESLDSSGNYYLVNTLLSPAAKACADSLLLGKKWQIPFGLFTSLPSYDDPIGDMAFIYQKNPSLFDDYISIKSDIFTLGVWISTGRGINQDIDKKHIMTYNSLVTVLNNSYQYVLCEGSL
jgi:hypothetical protein